MDRFFSKIRKTDSCWEWTASLNRFGYGKFGIGDGVWMLAHRFSWILANGAISDGACVCHRCDNRACVNPEHLFLGSHSDNMLDMAKKGRSRGLLAPAQVREIRTSNEPVRILAERFGVRAAVVYSIRENRRYVHV